MCKISFFLLALFIFISGATDKLTYTEESIGYKRKFARFVEKSPSPRQTLKRAQTFVASKWKSILDKEIEEELITNTVTTPSPLENNTEKKKKLSEQTEHCPKSKTKITTFNYGSLQDLHIMKEYENLADGIALLDTSHHILKIVNEFPPYDHQIIYEVKELHYTEGAFTAVTNTNKIITFGLAMFGGKGPGVEIEDIIGVASTSRAFAVWTKKGDVYAWGHEGFGSITTGVNLKNIRYVVGTTNAFTALDAHGKVKTWSSLEKRTVTNLKNIVHLTSIDESFAALDSTGNIFSWSSVNPTMIYKSYSIKTLVSTGREFGVLTNDGEFFSWDNNLEKKFLHQRPNISIELNPGKIGIYTYDNGTIKQISSNAQKAIINNGVTKEWKIATVNFKPFSQQLLTKEENRLEKNVIEFIRPTLVDNIEVRFNGFWIQYKDGAIRLV